MEQIWLKIQSIFGKFNFLSRKESRMNSPSYELTIAPKIKSNGPIGKLEINSGIKPEVLPDLITSIIQGCHPVFRDIAQTVFEQRVSIFKERLLEELKLLLSQELEKLKDPDTQFAIIGAARISGRQKNEDRIKLLSRLLANRIRNSTHDDKEEFKNIVCDEAIATVNKLTDDQLKIITLCYLLNYQHRHITSQEQLIEHLNCNVEPFLDFNNDLSEFQHIEYTRCGSIAGPPNTANELINVLLDKYSFLRFKEITPEELLTIPEEIRNDLVNKEDNRFYQRFHYDMAFGALNGKIKDNTVKEEMNNFYRSKIISNLITDKEIIENVSCGERLLHVYRTASLSTLSLTSVGIALAIHYFNQVTDGDFKLPLFPR